MADSAPHQPWKNFSIWRGRLPHWRADSVTYYVTFRHRRDLIDGEMGVLYRELLKKEGRAWGFVAFCILPNLTEILVKSVSEDSNRKVELSKFIEKAKAHAGKRIIDKTMERFPPFYDESFDRIIRDVSEFEEKLVSLISAPIRAELCVESNQYRFLWVSDDPQFSDHAE